MDKYQAILPYPISVNDLYKKGRGRVYLNPKVKVYRKEVWAILYKAKFGSSAVRLDIFMNPRRKTADVDNVLKTILDSLQHAGVLDNDNQVEELFIKRKEVVEFGQIDLTITKL